MVHLRLFGSVELERGDGTSIQSVLAQPKRLALLAYLAAGVGPGFVRRDRLLALFWPEKDDEHARNALRQSLHFLRRSLGEGVLDTRGDEEVGVDFAALDVDVLGFQALLSGGDGVAQGPVPRGPPRPGDARRGAVGGGRAEPPRPPGLARRAEVAVQAEGSGDPETALTYARRALEMMPGNDAALRLVMTALRRSGDRQGALEAFERFLSYTADELDLAPEPETVTLAEAIRSGDLAGAASPPSPLRATPEGGADPMKPSPIPSPALPASRRPARAVALALVGTLAVVAIALGLRLWPGPAAGPGERDARVILAEFEDATGETLGPVVQGALRIDLQRSSAVRPVEAAEVARALDLMGVGAGIPLTPEAARTVALREGIPAVLEGAVAKAGRGYILSVTLREAASGRVVASARSEAADPRGVIDAIDRLSRELRRRGGESLQTIQAQEPLARVTTGSLEALRFYTDGLRAFGERNDRVLAARLFEQAVALDSTFAMAWRQLSVALQGGVDPPRRVEAVERAYRHRERLSPMERLAVEAHYHQLRGPRGAALEAYERLLVLDPDNGTALNNLGLMHRMVDELDQAAAYLRRAVASTGRSSTAYVNLLDTELSRNRGDEAAAVLRALEAAYPSYELNGGRRFWVAFVQGDTARAATHAHLLADDTAGSPADRAVGLTLLAHLAYWSGRLDEGRSLLVRAEALLGEDEAATAWHQRLLAGFAEAVVGDADWARSWLRDGMTRAATLPPHQRDPRATALTLAYAGDHIGARDVLPAWRDALTGASPPAVAADLGRTARYVLAEAGGSDTGDPLLALPTMTVCEDACWVYHRARYHDVRGEIAEAIAAYERVREGGYTNWGPNVAQRLHAMMRLGPLYEAAGDTVQAVEAYRRLADQWAHGGPRGQAVVRVFRERLAALGG